MVSHQCLQFYWYCYYVVLHLACGINILWPSFRLRTRRSATYFSVEVCVPQNENKMQVSLGDLHSLW